MPYASASEKRDPKCQDFISDMNIKLEVLVNLISMAINIPTEEKQKLLELPEIGLRYEILLHFIDNEISLDSVQKKTLLKKQELQV